METAFDAAWAAHEVRIQALLATLRDTSSLQLGAIIGQPLVPLPIVKLPELLENAPVPPTAAIPEQTAEIKPPVNVVAPVDQPTTGNGSHRGDDKNGNSHHHHSDARRYSSHSNRRPWRRGFPAKRYKFKVATDTPKPLRPVGAAPATIPPNLRVGHPEAIFAYAPVSRLAMTYGWQYLRRPVPDGPANVLDISATIARVAHQGFFLTPVYRRWQTNHAHLMFLIDQDGSMAPFHDIAHDLIATAREESSIKQVDAFYFHDVFDDSVYEDEHFYRWKTVDEAMQSCTPNTSILIVSDAGAARGKKNDERGAAALKMVLRLQQSTNLVAWLNPMPRDRWKESTAEIIANEVQMFQLDTDGFSSAVDVLQGRGVAS
jgi:hypothetical protein